MNDNTNNSKNRFLHLTAWYPSESTPFRTPFIPAHFHAINTAYEHKLWHVEVQYRSGWPSLNFSRTTDQQHHRVLTLPTRRARLIEFATLLLLLLVRLELGKRWWSGVHVHIAWPLIRFPRIFRFLFGGNVLIGEHWSAYHDNFHLPFGSPPHRRMAAMFSQKFPVCTVSPALAEDIRRFAAPHHFPVHVIPNVVDPKDFHPAPQNTAAIVRPAECKARTRFLMVANWQPIKRPLLVLEACHQAVEAGVELELRIVGDGPQHAEMVKFVATGLLAGRVTFLGPLDKPKIADEMRAADALLHPSAYETFSVVCAEAISCGTPVLASRLEAIGEFIDHSNGVLVDNTVDAWREAILRFCHEPNEWDRTAIAERAHARFSPAVVGRQFRELYRALWQQSS